MRTIVACAWICAAAIAGCAHPDNPSASLTITPNDPSGTVAITGPTDFSAVIANDTQSDDTVSWTVKDGGSISSATGLHTVFTPAPGAGATATLTATTASGLTATVKVAFGNAVLTSGTIPTLTAPVTVLYDAEDIPHIKCAQAADCVAVQGYIHARDRFFMMDFLRHVGRSNLAELIGVDGLSQDVTIRTLFKTRDGKRLEEELVANMDPKMLALITAYSSGVNAYLTDLKAHPANLPGEYKQLPLPPAPTDIADWTPADTMAVARLQQFQLSETLNEELDFAQFAARYAPGQTPAAPAADPGRYVAWIRSAAPKGEQAHTLSPTPHTGAIAVRAPKRNVKSPVLAPYLGALGDYRDQVAKLTERLRPYEATVGSNNWVISAAKSKTGKAMVANDPHLSLQYPPLFHLAAMTSANADDHLDLTGGAFPGIPGALVGRGQHVGWGVTVVGYDVTDIYIESISLATGKVVYLGQPENLTVVPETFLVKTANGLVNASTLGTPTTGGFTITGVGFVPSATLIAPHHGPIVKQLDATTALSARWTGQEGNTQDLSAFFGLDTATDVDSAIVALKNYATGAQNFVLADDQGHIAYDPHALVPIRTWANETAANPHLPWLPVPGYNGQAEWGDGSGHCADTGATPVPATCWISDDALPHGKDPDKGYFFTANSDPTSDANGVGKTDNNDPIAASVQPYMSFQWDDSTGFRATEIQTRIEAAIAAGGVSLDDMMSIQADHISRIGKQFDSYIAAMPTTNDSADLTNAKAILAKWDADGNDCPSGLTGSDPNNSGIDTSGTVVDDSAGCFLFHAFLRHVITNVFDDDIAATATSSTIPKPSQLQAIKSLLWMLKEAGDAPPYNNFCGTAKADGTLAAPVAAGACGAQVATALTQAYDEIVGQFGSSPTQWKWGKVHTMQPVSLLALVTNGYEPGPYARPGGAFTVDVGTPSTSAKGLEFPFSSSGNVRHISVMDAGTPVVKMQLPGPERDGPTGFGGPDLLGQWVLNKYFDFLFGNQIDSGSVSTQTFTAH